MPSRKKHVTTSRKDDHQIIHNPANPDVVFALFGVVGIVLLALVLFGGESTDVGPAPQPSAPAGTSAAPKQ